MEVIVSIAIIGIFMGFAITRFGDVNNGRSLEKEADEIIEIAALAQSLADSRNSASCEPTTADRLSFVELTKTGATTYELTMACETGFQAGTPTILPTHTLNPPIAKTLSTGQFDTATSEVLARFVPGARVTPGVDFKMYEGGNCVCVRVFAEGFIKKTKRTGGCTMSDATTPVCSLWDHSQ